MASLIGLVSFTGALPTKLKSVLSLPYGLGHYDGSVLRRVVSECAPSRPVRMDILCTANDWKTLVDKANDRVWYVSRKSLSEYTPKDKINQALRDVLRYRQDLDAVLLQSKSYNLNDMFGYDEVGAMIPGNTARRLLRQKLTNNVPTKQYLLECDQRSRDDLETAVIEDSNIKLL
jgi:hypothetical protein